MSYWLLQRDTCQTFIITDAREMDCFLWVVKKEIWKVAVKLPESSMETEFERVVEGDTAD